MTQLPEQSRRDVLKPLGPDSMTCKDFGICSAGCASHRRCGGRGAFGLQDRPVGASQALHGIALADCLCTSPEGD